MAGIHDVAEIFKLFLPNILAVRNIVRRSSGFVKYHLAMVMAITIEPTAAIKLNVHNKQKNMNHNLSSTPEAK